MSRKFITEKEFEYINKINKELIQNFTGEEVIYYAISKEHTVVHRLYNEAISKVWFHPVRVNARVEYDNPGDFSTSFTIDSQYDLIVYFHNQELRDRNVKPITGDFIEYGQIIFEITSVAQPQRVFGQINNKIMTKCVCKPSREGQMQIYGEHANFVDNTHQIQDPECDDC